MFYRVFLSAVVAGVLGGLVISAVQAVTTIPLILQAEKYETASSAPQAPKAMPLAGTHAHSNAGIADKGHDDGEAWAPNDGVERTAYTVMANILAGFGFALLIVACFALSGRDGNPKTGVLWGLGGFAVFTLGPGLGLPPELPATAAADLAARQGWWILAAGTTAFGLWLLVFRQSVLAKALGVFALVLPHAIGAPHPLNLTKAVPPELAAHFASSSIVTSALFWVLLGWLAGTAYMRLGKAENAGEPRPAIV